MQKQASRLVRFDKLTQFNSIIWSVIIGTLIVRTSYFMAWPFLILILYRDYGVSATEVGAMLGGSALMSVLIGFYSGYLSDKFGRKWIIVLGCCISVVAYYGLSKATQVYEFYILIIMCGLMRPMIEEPSKALISDNVSSTAAKELALNLRYFAINIGGALGPLLGVKIAVSNPTGLFQITSVTYLIYAAWLLVVLRRYSAHRHVQQSNNTIQPLSFFRVMVIIKNDHLFKKLLIANILMMFVYAHYGSTLPQIVTRSGLDNAEAVIAGFVMINTFTVVIFQFPLLRLLGHYSLATRVNIGVGLMGASQVLFAALPESSAYGWFFAAFVLSLGEVIAFPTLNVQIDRLAPSHLRGAYFGAASMSAIGFSTAPLLGGIIIESLNALWLFSLCFVLCVVIFCIYRNIGKESAEQESKLVTP